MSHLSTRWPTLINGGIHFKIIIWMIGDDSIQIQKSKLNLLEILKSGLQAHDAVMMMGRDIIFTNFARKIEDIIKDDPRVIVDKEHFGMDCVNNDVMIFPKGEQSNDFIKPISPTTLMKGLSGTF